MSKVCKKHIEKPAMIYKQCIGCELEWYQKRIRDLEKGLSYYAEQRHIKYQDGKMLAEDGQLARSIIAKID